MLSIWKTALIGLKSSCMRKLSIVGAIVLFPKVEAH